MSNVENARSCRRLLAAPGALDAAGDRHVRVRIKVQGGRIFFATAGERCVGCGALIPLKDGEFEVAKMAVEPFHQRAGIGRKLLQTAIKEARNAGAQRLYLETNYALTPAIRLYESLGFKHIEADRIIPSPYERADVYMELILP